MTFGVGRVQLGGGACCVDCDPAAGEWTDKPAYGKSILLKMSIIR